MLSNRNALITGAFGALGNFVTREFLASGTRIAALTRELPAGDEGRAILSLPVDLSDADSTREAVGSVSERLGKIDILVHLVGGYAGGKSVHETDDATFDRMLNMNLRSAFNVCRSVIPHMRRARHGRIVAVGSRIAVEPQAASGAYGASKAALISLVRTVAIENREYGITANIVLPGTIDTPANRSAMPDADTANWVSPAQVAKLILWLSTDEASQVSGAQIPIYGRGL